LSVLAKLLHEELQLAIQEGWTACFGCSLLDVYKIVC
jgi:hypothetical protein